MTPHRHGMTLLELLLACSFLSIIVVSLGSWTRSLAGHLALLVSHSQEQRELNAAILCLRSDLSSSVGRSITINDEHSEIRFSTINRLPGEPALVRGIGWSITEGFLIRARTPTDSRIVDTTTYRFSLGRFKTAQFEWKQSGQIWCTFADETRGEESVRTELLFADWSR
jgi:type II secretory pathway component PulJ